MAIAEETRREAWVHEKGLPHRRHGSLLADIGRRLLLATDLTPASRDAETRAIELAERIPRARLLVVAVVRPGTEDGGTAADAVRRLVARARERGIDAAGGVCSGEPGHVIVEVAAASCADAIIVGGDAWTSPEAATCTCGHVIRHASCRVLVVNAASDRSPFAGQRVGPDTRPAPLDDAVRRP
jgi:nucleotide-binding universal stress UspA family protein